LKTLLEREETNIHTHRNTDRENLVRKRRRRRRNF
jgi:hypothetical protein